MSQKEDRRKAGVEGAMPSAGAADHSRSKIPQFPAGFDGANTNPGNHVFQADKRGRDNKIISLNRDGDIRTSTQKATEYNKTHINMSFFQSHGQRTKALDQLICRINYHTGLSLRIDDFIPTAQARDRTRMWTNEPMDVAWRYNNNDKPVEMRIPNKDPTKAPRSVFAMVDITMDAHDAHVNSGPDWPHYGAHVHVSAPDKPDVSWAVSGVQSFEEKRTKSEKPSPSITDDLVMHVLVDAVPASQSSEEFSPKKA